MIICKEAVVSQLTTHTPQKPVKRPRTSTSFCLDVIQEKKLGTPLIQKDKFRTIKNLEEKEKEHKSHVFFSLMWTMQKVLSVQIS